MASPSNDIASALTYLTVDTLNEMRPADRQFIRDECERVCRIIEGDRVVDDGRATPPPRNKVGVLRQAWETD